MDRLKMTRMLMTSILLWLPAGAQVDSNVCVPSKENYQGPPLPVLPETFTVRVEANLLNKNTTVDVREWHDGTGNRGAASVWLTSVQFRYIYSYVTNEQFSFEQEAGGRYGCQVKELNRVTEPYLHGTDTVATGNGSLSHIYSAARALSFAGSLAERYLGSSRVREIPTDAWESCVYWPDLNATMRVTWYFTAPQGWDTAVGVAQVPVRCHVTGRVHSGAAPRTFEHIYEVTEFFHHLDGAGNVFETPAGTVCPHRKNSRAIPTLPARFSYGAEILEINSQSVQFQKTAYDSQLKMYLLEFPSTYPPYIRQRALSDFNTGVKYLLNTQTGNCTVSVIDPADVIGINGTAVRMPMPHEFFGPETDYTYEGTRDVRQLTADVWIGRRKMGSEDVTWECYFATPDWKEKAGVTSASSMPVSCHVFQDRQANVDTMYNIYDFRDGDPRLWEFDITSCFDDSQGFRAVSLRFYATLTQFQTVSTNQNAFRRALLDSVMSLVTISPVRLNNIRLEFRQGEIDAEMVITEAADTTLSRVTSPLQELPLSTVLTRLQDAVNRRQLHVTVATPTGGSVTLVATTPSQTTPSATTTQATPSATTTTTTTTAAQAKPSAPPTSQATPPFVTPTTRHQASGGSVVVCAPQVSGYTPGDVAGVTMGTTLACYVAALLGVSLWARRRGREPDYHRERLEMS